MLNVDQILQAFQRRQVAFMLIGGVNFLIRHAPHVTFDIDLWIEDTAENRRKCEHALADVGAEWGATDADWGPVCEKAAGWLDRQAIYCLTSPHGAIDVFRSVRGLDQWRLCFDRSVPTQTSEGVSFAALGDLDMLRCQLALDEADRKPQRIAILEAALQRSGGTDAR